LSLKHTDIINSSLAHQFARATAETDSSYSLSLEEEIF